MPGPQPIKECPPHRKTRVITRGKFNVEVCVKCGTTVRQWLNPNAR
jgi:hypothetical protein